MRRCAWHGGVGLFAVWMLVALSAQTAAPLRPLVPIDAISGILDAFRTHSVVGMDAGAESGDQRAVDFLLSLIRDPRFTAIVNDLMVEGYSGRYQDALDQFVRGEDVPHAALRPLWLDTTMVFPGTDEVPEIVRAVRALNATLPRERRLRVLAPDPPIDWDQVHTHDDYQRWLAQRDSFPAQLTLREVIAKRRRVLAVWGGGHLQRKNQGSNYQQMDEPIAATYVSLLEAAGTHVFVIGGASIEEEAVRAKWPVPSIAMLRGTAAGAADQGNIPALPQRFSIRNGQLTPIPRDQWISMRVEDQLDAAIWIGPASGRRTKPLSPSSCTPEFLDRSARRRPLTGRPGPDPLKDFCATLTPK